MKIHASTDGVGKTLEIIRDSHETSRDEIRILSQLILYLMQELQRKL